MTLLTGLIQIFVVLILFFFVAFLFYMGLLGESQSVYNIGSFCKSKIEFWDKKLKPYWYVSSIFPIFLTIFSFITMVMGVFFLACFILLSFFLGWCFKKKLDKVIFNYFMSTDLTMKMVFDCVVFASLSFFIGGWSINSVFFALIDYIAFMSLVGFSEKVFYNFKTNKTCLEANICIFKILCFYSKLLLVWSMLVFPILEAPLVDLMTKNIHTMFFISCIVLGVGFYVMVIDVSPSSEKSMWGVSMVIFLFMSIPVYVFCNWKMGSFYELSVQNSKEFFGLLFSCVIASLMLLTISFLRRLSFMLFFYFSVLGSFTFPPLALFSFLVSVIWAFSVFLDPELHLKISTFYEWLVWLIGGS